MAKRVKREPEWKIERNLDTGEFLWSGADPRFTNYSQQMNPNREALPYNFKFQSVMVFEGFTGGPVSRSKAIFIDLTNGFKLCMWTKDFSEIIKTTTLQNGFLVGTWGFRCFYNKLGIVPIKDS